MSTEYIHDGYNINVVMNAFKNVVRSDGVTIDLDGFVFAYRELVKLFDKLGKLFVFVRVELNSKFENLEECLLRDRTHYMTVQNAIEYEKKSDIHMHDKNATLSVLRLMRGLDFIRHLISNLYENRDNTRKSHDIVGQAYDQTLGHRHRWSVRKIVKAGLYLLPRKADLLDIVLIGADKSMEIDVIFRETLGSIDKVFSIIHKLYDDNHFLELVHV